MKKKYSPEVEFARSQPITRGEWVDSANEEEKVIQRMHIRIMYLEEKIEGRLPEGWDWYKFKQFIKENPEKLVAYGEP